jgi:hypothetical protein
MMKSPISLKRYLFLGLQLSLLVLTSQAHALLEPTDSKQSTCQESWYEWAALTTADEAPKTSKKVNIYGRPAQWVYPESEDRGIRFSALLNTNFSLAKARAEQQQGIRFGDCEQADGYRTCGKSLGPKHSVTLMEIRAGKHPQTLISCFRPS